MFGKHTCGGRREDPQGRKGSVKPLRLRLRGTITEPSVTGHISAIIHFLPCSSVLAPCRHQQHADLPGGRSVVLPGGPVRAALPGAPPGAQRRAADQALQRDGAQSGLPLQVQVPAGLPRGQQAQEVRAIGRAERFGGNNRIEVISINIANVIRYTILSFESSL